MPQTRQLRWAQLRVGVMSLVAIAILVVLIFLVTARAGLFAKTSRIYTYVDDSASLKVGAAVRLNGIDVGNVGAVGLSGEGGNRTIIIGLDVRREYLPRIPVDSQASINPEGVFGDKYVNITRGQSPTSVKPGGEIRSLDTREFQEVVNQSYNVLTSLNDITRRVDSVVSGIEVGRGTIGKLLSDETLYNRIDAVVRQAQDVVGLVSNGNGTIGKLLKDDELYAKANATLSHVEDVVANVQSGRGTIGMLLNDPALYQNANRVVEQAQTLVNNVNAGQGTVGKLLKDEEMYRKVNGTLDKVGATLDQVNSGRGTIGQLLVNRALYDSTTGLTTEMRELIRDIRANPKKFLRVKFAIF